MWTDIDTARRIGRAAEVADDLAIRLDPADARVRLEFEGEATVRQVLVVVSLRPTADRLGAWQRGKEAVDAVIETSAGYATLHSVSPDGFSVEVL